MRKPEWEASCHHMSTCALTGSAAFFAAIPGSFILVNGPLWCYFYAMKYIEDYDASAGNRFHCTQPENNALVYGTEKDLLAGLDFVKTNFTPERVFIQSNCSVSLVGDDTAGIAARAGLPCPVYTMDSGGLAGDFPEGYQKAFLRIIEEIPSRNRQKQTDSSPFKNSSPEPLPTTGKSRGTDCPDNSRANACPRQDHRPSVNLLGLTPTYFRGEEDIEELRRLLEKAGYRVNAIPGGGSPWEEIMRLPEADLNIVVREELAAKAAEKLKATFGTPWLSAGLPYGTEGTLRWLKRIAEALPGGDLTALEAEAAQIRSRLQFRGGNMQSLWGTLWFDTILVSAPPSEAAGIAEALRGEWADTGRLIIHFMHDTEARPEAADDIYIAGKDDAAIKHVFDSWEDGLVLGSSLEISRLLRLKKKFTGCPIALPAYQEMLTSDLPLCGLRGAAFLFERIWNARLSRMMAEPLPDGKG